MAKNDRVPLDPGPPVAKNDRAPFEPGPTHAERQADANAKAAVAAINQTPAQKAKAHPVATRTLKVRATERGYYEHQLKEPGAVFNLTLPEKEALPSWVEATTAEADATAKAQHGSGTVAPGEMPKVVTEGVDTNDEL